MAETEETAEKEETTGKEEKRLAKEAEACRKRKRQECNRKATRELRKRKRVKRDRQIAQIEDVRNCVDMHMKVLRDAVLRQRSLAKLLPPSTTREKLLQSTHYIEEACLPPEVTEQLFSGLDKLCCTPTIARKPRN